MKHLFIINPIAGGKKGDYEETKSIIQKYADKHKIPYEIYITKGPMDAPKKIVEEAKTEELLYVYACGGDGTLNECVNGAALRDNVAVTNYPCGTGNDFVKTFGDINVERFRDLDELITGEIIPLDLIDCDGRYGISICSVGIDARIANDVHKYSSIPVIGGATGYVVALIVNVLKGVSQKVRVSYDEKIIETPTTLVCACNGRYYGGGFNPVPDAMPDDGIIDFLIVDEVSRLKVAQVVGKYKVGRFRELGNLAIHYRGQYMQIEDDKEFVVNIDGEIIHASKISFKMIPKGVKFLFPKDMKYV